MVQSLDEMYKCKEIKEAEQVFKKLINRLRHSRLLLFLAFHCQNSFTPTNSLCPNSLSIYQKNHKNKLPHFAAAQFLLAYKLLCPVVSVCYVAYADLGEAFI